jgi:hypothetical protein
MVTTNVNFVNTLIFFSYKCFLIVMFLECDSGFYGTNCIKRCGHCYSDPCNHVDGTCNLCSYDYFGTKCDKSVFMVSFLRNFILNPFTLFGFFSCQKVLVLIPMDITHKKYI